MHKYTVKLQAHRGVNTEYPENTMSAFRAAVEQGYSVIECDLKCTSDGKLVFLHDLTLNRTARKQDGSMLEKTVIMSDITFTEAITYDYGLFKGEQFRGEKLVTLRELLDFARETQISLKIDNSWQSFSEEIREKIIDTIAEYGDTVRVGLTCTEIDILKYVVDKLPYADIHYDGANYAKENLDTVAELSKGHRFVIWVAFGGDERVWFKGPFASIELCEFVKSYGELGLWKLSKYEQLEEAVNVFKADIIETDGQIKPHMC